MREDILALVYSAVDEIDPMTADGAALAKSPMRACSAAIPA